MATAVHSQYVVNLSLSNLQLGGICSYNTEKIGTYIQKTINIIWIYFCLWKKFVWKKFLCLQIVIDDNKSKSPIKNNDVQATEEHWKNVSSTTKIIVFIHIKNLSMRLTVESSNFHRLLNEHWIKIFLSTYQWKTTSVFVFKNMSPCQTIFHFHLLMWCIFHSNLFCIFQFGKTFLL